MFNVGDEIEINKIIDPDMRKYLMNITENHVPTRGQIVFIDNDGDYIVHFYDFHNGNNCLLSEYTPDKEDDSHLYIMQPMMKHMFHVVSTKETRDVEDKVPGNIADELDKKFQQFMSDEVCKVITKKAMNDEKFSIGDGIEVITTMQIAWQIALKKIKGE